MIKVNTFKGCFVTDGELAPCPVCGKTPDVFALYDSCTGRFFVGITCYGEDGVSHVRTNANGATKKTAVLHAVYKWNHKEVKISEKEDKENG